MPKKYKVTDSSTGKTYTFDWNGAQPPTDADLDEIFASAKGPEQPAPELPLTRQRGPHGGPVQPEHPYAKLGRLATDNLPMIGGIAGGLAAAPFTGGMSIPAALALGAGGAAIGGAAGAAGRAGIKELEGVDDGISSPGDLGKDMALESAIQGGSRLIGGGLTAGAGKVLQKGGEGLYRLALRPEMKELASKFPGVTRAGLAQEAIRGRAGITQNGAARVGGLIAGNENAATQAVAALPKGTTVPMKVLTDAAKPALTQARSEAAANKVVKPLFQHVKNMKASHPDQIPVAKLLEMQRATAVRGGLPSGVTPTTPQPLGTNLIRATDRAVAGAAQKNLEQLAPTLVPINQQLPTQYALRAAIEQAVQRPALSQYMTTGAVAPLGGAAFGGVTGYQASGGDPLAGFAGAAAGALLTNPRTLGNAAIRAGQMGANMLGRPGILPQAGMSSLIGAAQQAPPPDVQTEQRPVGDLQPFLDPFPLPPPTPLDPMTGMRLIPKEDYWTPR